MTVVAEYSRQSNKLLLRGMNVAFPGDRLGMEWAQSLVNVRCYRPAEWRQRPGLTAIGSTGSGSPILWEQRINDYITDAYRRLAASQSGEVFVDDALHTTYSLTDTGYGDGGYSSVVVRPDASTLPFVFLGNSSRHSKFDTLGNRTNWGLPSPAPEPRVELDATPLQVVDECDSTGGWVGTGGAVSTQVRINTTISEILYDTGSDRWASIVPAAMAENFQPGALITFVTDPEYAIVDAVLPQIKTSVIESIQYDSGTTGACVIQLELATLGLQRDMLLELGGTELVRVLSVTESLDGGPSFRCVTTSNHVAGEAVVGFRSFRVFLNNSHAPGETITATYLQIAVAGAGISTLAKTAAVDMSTTTNNGNRPMQPEDFVHFSLNISDFTQVTEIQIQFDVDASVNDFTRNYFFKSVRPPDLQAAYAQTAPSITAQQQELQRQQIDDFRRQQLMQERAQLEANTLGDGGMFESGINAGINMRLSEINAELNSGFTTVSGQGALSTPGVGGDSQWTELFIPLSEFQRVGSDTSRGWQNVAAYQITINTTAAVNVGLDAIWIGGTFGPNAPIDSPQSGYRYCYRFRNTDTGSTSAFSPPTRFQVYPRRGAVLIVGDTAYADPQADVCDYFRIGGTLGEWHYVGTADVGALEFQDTIADDIAVRNPVADFDHFQPWVTNDIPKSGVCSVVGTTLNINVGDTLDLQYVRGNQIIVGERLCSFYAPPDSTTQVQLNESLGTLSGVTWQIPNPTLEGQPLPVVFGPYGGGVSGLFTFGLGDPLNPGTLYWTIGNDTEACSDSGYLELSSPSEPLIGGKLLDGIIYVWSDARSWRILPSFAGGQSGGGSLFYAQETAMGKGLAGPWACTAGDQLYFAAWDGIYASRGDAVQSLTDESLTPLFRRDGTTVEGGPYQSIPPINFDNQAALSLTYSKDGLYFTFQGTDTAYYSFFYSFLTQGWMQDIWAFTATRFFREEGNAVDNLLMGNSVGNLLQVDALATADDIFVITCDIVTREEDWGDSRATKQLADVMIDINCGGVSVGAELQLNNNTLPAVPLDFLTGTTRERLVRSVAQGIGVQCITAALHLNWTTQSGRVYVYEWQPAALVKPEVITKRATDFEDGGYNGYKWLQGVRITADTYGAVKELYVQTSDGQTVPLTITTDREATVARSWAPIRCHEMRLVGTNLTGTDSTDWRLRGVEWIFEPEPEPADNWTTQFTSLDFPGYHDIISVLIPYRADDDVQMLLLYDDGSTSAPYTLPASGGEWTKAYQTVGAKKSKLVQFQFTGTSAYALALKDVEVRAKPWGTVGASYQSLKPFGDISRENGGARI